MPARLCVFGRAAACFLMVSVCTSPAKAIQLITLQEAAYPDDPYGESRGSPSPGPEIEVLSPTLRGVITSPFDLKIKFSAHGGATVERNSIAIIYRKLPLVDITQRISNFISPKGINIPEAELPPGTHSFKVVVKDSRGRWATPLFFTIGVER